MQSSKYLIASGAVDWTKGLETYYAEDERKRREHGERLKARDAEQLKVMAEQSPIKMLEKLSSFSQTIGTLAKQQRAAQENKEKLEDNKLQEMKITKKGIIFVEDKWSKFN